MGSANAASGLEIGGLGLVASGGARPASRTLRPIVTAVVTAVVMPFLVLWLLPAVPASAWVLGVARDPAEPELSRVEARRYERWWTDQVLVGSLALADMPLAELREAAEGAWAAGVTRRQLRAALFGEAALTVFAANAAGGEGRTSPYLQYFTNNPAQLGPLGEVLSASGEYVGGPGGTQEELFGRFAGLRESYLASLGLAEVDGRIVDPRNPYLTPYLVSLSLGPPEPLPQPAVALNVPAP
jgi:hypothetical protein